MLQFVLFSYNITSRDTYKMFQKRAHIQQWARLMALPYLSFIQNLTYVSNRLKLAQYVSLTDSVAITHDAILSKLKSKINCTQIQIIPHIVKYYSWTLEVSVKTHTNTQPDTHTHKTTHTHTHTNSHPPHVCVLSMCA